MKRLYIFLICISVLSCIDDKTVHEFNEIPEWDVTIGIKHQMDAILNDVLHIDPIVKFDTVMWSPALDTTFTLANKEIAYNKDDYTYAWTIMLKDFPHPLDTLSTKPVLDVPVSPKYYSPGNAYTLSFNMTHKETNVNFRDDLELNIIGIYDYGCLMLCREDGQTELNFYQPEESETPGEYVSYEGKMKENIFALENDGELLPPYAHKVLAIEGSYGMEQILIGAKDATGGALIDFSTMVKKGDLMKAFEGSPSVASANLQGWTEPSSFAQYLTWNGRLSKRQGNMKEIFWDSHLVTTSEPYGYEVDPIPLDIKKYGCFFDKMHGRLVNHTAYNKGYLGDVPMDKAYPHAYDVKNLGANRTCVAASLGLGTYDRYFILKDIPTDKFYLYRYVMKKSGYNYYFQSTETFELDKIICPNLSNEHGVQTYYQMKGYIFYVKDNKVYASYVAGAEEGGKSIETMLVDLGAENIEITGFKVGRLTLKTSGHGNMITRNQVRVMIKDNNLAGKKGGMISYEIDFVAGVNLQEISRVGGFCDEVIDFDSKL